MQKTMEIILISVPEPSFTFVHLVIRISLENIVIHDLCRAEAFALFWGDAFLSLCHCLSFGVLFFQFLFSWRQTQFDGWLFSQRCFRKYSPGILFRVVQSYSVWLLFTCVFTCFEALLSSALTSTWSHRPSGAVAGFFPW